MLERFPVHVIVERRPAVSRWIDHVWRVVAVVPGRVEAPAWHVLAEADGVTRYLAGSTDLMVHPAETAALKDNLEAPTPSVYVVLRPDDGPIGWRLLLATVDPAEAHSHSDSGSDLVEALPMAEPIRVWIARFVATHHVERTVYKRQRDRSEKDGPRRRPVDGWTGKDDE
ncbi:DUF3305 domain-containing protein [Chthonobacter rhizosphaerae]|uniref:DUF3305 domain-containing protein n=1 Tax=Chthonobacter rhizosphaerae TaxID=2735553 RepID=UPI0015EE7564|nr:DUF3305 domain-containing protein [Chthonobacter rhizosphaerae]